ncbi:MAG TPA: hypothetical protein PK252_08795 [Bacteroidales bacterium]|nr:hypothetical protein [Bacteroidales bacterium]
MRFVRLRFQLQTPLIDYSLIKYLWLWQSVSRTEALTATEANKNNNGIDSTDELREYVSVQEAKASGSIQHPAVDRDNIYQKFGFPLK